MGGRTHFKLRWLRPYSVGDRQRLHQHRPPQHRLQKMPRRRDFFRRPVQRRIPRRLDQANVIAHFNIQLGRNSIARIERDRQSQHSGQLHGNPPVRQREMLQRLAS